MHKGEGIQSPHQVPHQMHGHTLKWNYRGEKVSKCWCKIQHTKYECNWKYKCKTFWSCHEHLQHLMHRPKWRLITKMIILWTRLHTHTLLTQLPEKLLNTLALSYAYTMAFHLHLYTHIFSSYNYICTLEDTIAHFHTNAQTLLTIMCDLLISSVSSWLSQAFHYNENFEIWLKKNDLTNYI